MKIDTQLYDKMPKELQSLFVVRHDNDCPVKMLDEQSGVLKSGDIKPHIQQHTNTIILMNSKAITVNRAGDKGGASRFFYCAKASKAERNAGCGGLFILKDNVPKEDIIEIKHLLSA